MTTHAMCGKTWSGKRAEHCPACCETFSSPSAGDKHRTGGYGNRVCRPPAEVGLVLRDKSGPVWGYPGDPDALSRLTGKAGAAQDAEMVLLARSEDSGAPSAAEGVPA